MFLEKTLKELKMIVEERPKLNRQKRNELHRQLNIFVEQKKAMNGPKPNQ